MITSTTAQGTLLLLLLQFLSVSSKCRVVVKIHCTCRIALYLPHCLNAGMIVKKYACIVFMPINAILFSMFIVCCPPSPPPPPNYRNPTAPKGKSFSDIPCLGAFGGPVDPNVALGGFSRKLDILDTISEYFTHTRSYTLSPIITSEEPSGSPDYQTAEALIISFIVKNHVNKSANKMAETWEKAFLDYLKDYNSSNINITYSAEVSEECIGKHFAQMAILRVFLLLSIVASASTIAHPLSQKMPFWRSKV